MAEVKKTLKLDENLFEDDNAINVLVEELSNKRANILNDFFRVYIAGRRLTAEQIKRLELVEEQNVSGFGSIFRFRLRKEN